MQNPKKPVNNSSEKNLNLFHVEGAATGIENAGIAYQSPSLVARGVQAEGVALMSFLTNLALSLVCIRAPRFIEKMGSPRQAMLLMSVINVAGWLPLILIFWLATGASPYLFAALWIINLVPALLDTPIRDAWLAGLLPKKTMGRYLGLRSIVTGAAYLVTFYVMGYTLDLYRDRGLTGFAVVFAIAAAAALASLVLYRIIGAPVEKKAPGEAPGFLDFLRETKRGNLGTFILFAAMFSFAVNISGPLFSVYMLTELRFSYLTFTLLISSEYIARIVSAPLWGRFSDRTSNLKIIGIIARFIPLIPLLWLVSPNPVYLVLVQFFSGAVWAGFDLYTQTFIYRVAPEAGRLRYIIYHRGLTTMGTALGALLGAYLLTVMVPVWGSKIMGLFLLSGLCRFLVYRTIFHRIADIPPSVRAAKPAGAWAALMNMAPFQPGLFYRPDLWPDFTRKPEFETDAPTENAYRGFFHRPADWKLFTGSLPAEYTVAAPSPKPAFYYRPQDWGQFVKEDVVTGKPKAGSGLYHNPDGWERYTGQKSAEPKPSRKEGLLRRRQSWGRYLDAAPNEGLITSRIQRRPGPAYPTRKLSPSCA
ncbi:MAG: MFS transporter [Chloroflexi bacterium]|nr:MFS transporter [Chloroflexota bacterium]